MLALVVAPGYAAGQATVHFGGALTLPTGQFANVASAGWMGHGALYVSPWDAPFDAGLAAFWGRNPHEPPPAGDRSEVYGALARLQYRYETGGLLAPYVGGMGGITTRRFRSESQPGLNGSRSRFAAGAVAGVQLPLQSVVGFLEAWWLSELDDVYATRLAGLSVGIGFTVGGM